MSGHSRVNLFIATFVVIQIAIPLAYYLGTNPYDERFAWRMFSPTRLAGCSVQAYRVDAGQRQQVSLRKEIHVVWYNLLKRARPAVIDAVGQKLCADGASNGGADVRLSIRCGNPNHSALGVCLDQQDRDGDNIPDGYSSPHAACEGLDAAACFTRDCSNASIQKCYATQCQTVIQDPSVNVCTAEAGS
ncbi:MAG: hypothetical protein ACON3Z_11670 [Bradymonadia bacterium]